MTQPYLKAQLPQACKTQQSRTTVQTTTVKPAQEKRAGRSAEASEYRRLYDTREWRDRLRPNQLTKEPLCRFCQIVGRVTEATVADHIENHRGDPALFFDPANLQSLCAPCHDRVKDQIERLGYHSMCDAEGFPLDPNHVANRKRP